MRVSGRRIFKQCFFTLLFIISVIVADAQCSICTRTAQQLGEKPAKGLNAGILYLAFAPLVIIGFVGYRVWRKQNGKTSA